MDPEDIEMLQDLVISAVNEVIREIEDESTKEMEKISGGMECAGAVLNIWNIMFCR